MYVSTESKVTSTTGSTDEIETARTTGIATENWFAITQWIDNDQVTC